MNPALTIGICTILGNTYHTHVCGGGVSSKPACCCCCSIGCGAGSPMLTLEYSSIQPRPLYILPLPTHVERQYFISISVPQSRPAEFGRKPIPERCTGVARVTGEAEKICAGARSIGRIGSMIGSRFRFG